MSKKHNAEKSERKILKISFIMGLSFAFVELFASIMAHSQSMLMDAAYDSTELVVIALTLFLTPLFHKPLTEKRPFGYSQVESVFIVIKNFMMFSVTIGLLGDTIQIMLNGGNTIDSSFIAKFQLALGIISFFVLYVIKKINHAISSPIIDTEIYGWKIDTYYSFGMAGAFFVATILKDSWFAPIIPYFDQIVAILIVIFMIPQSIKMLASSIKNMFLFSPDEQTIGSIKNMAESILKEYSYKLETCDIYKTGRVLWVDVYITTENESIMITDFSSASVQLQKQLSSDFENCSTQIILQGIEALPANSSN